MELNPVEAAPHERAENQNPMPNPPITTHIETARAAHDPNAHNYIVWIQSAVNPDGRRQVVNASTSVCALQPAEAATIAVLYLADKLEETGRKPADGTVYRLSVNETRTDQTWSMELTYHERDNADHPSNAKDASTGEADPTLAATPQEKIDTSPASMTTAYANDSKPSKHEVLLVCQENSRGEGTRLEESDTVLAMGPRHAAALAVESYRRRVPEMIPTTTGTTYYRAEVTSAGHGNDRQEASIVELAYHAKRGLINTVRTVQSTTIH